MNLEEHSDIKAKANSLEELVIDQKNLEYLQVAHELKPGTLPAQIKYFSNLKSLECRGNRLTSLPVEIWELSKLEILDCNHNHLRSLPPEIGLLTRLKTLLCMYNQLRSLPKEIGKLSQLENIEVQ